MQKPLLYKKTAARQILGSCGNTKLHDLIAGGKLKAVKFGGSTMITAESLDEYVASLPPVNLRKSGAAK
ncbi:helix-turn-helix domain-containing protein [Reyranella soli]|uniref:Uncharacterized protein n=1 Tax=Reyranella soli TaxID=1230389 RepID=A0A512NKI9_9HYPH|nr:helix-turn-helix domain-containing protein [Reyranella soli]GEP59461.1 hypothetical protein RSO01_66270 [Reyranella soli]